MEELSVLVAWRLDPPPATHVRTKAGPPLSRGSSVLDDEDAIWAADEMDDARRRDAEAVVEAQGRVLAPFWVDKYDREAVRPGTASTGGRAWRRTRTGTTST